MSFRIHVVAPRRVRSDSCRVLHATVSLLRAPTLVVKPTGRIHGLDRGRVVSAASYDVTDTIVAEEQLALLFERVIQMWNMPAPETG